MEQPQNFRAAFNGFNREDVARYLEYLTARHSAQMNQLIGETEEFRRQLAKADPVETEALRTRCGELELLLAQEREAKELLNQQTEELQQQVGQLQQQLEQARLDLQVAQSEAQKAQDEAQKADTAQQAALNSCAARELEAYRRAERAERVAKERADQVYRQTSSVLADATGKVDDAAQQIVSVTDQVMAQLNLLQCAVSSSRLALQEAAAIMNKLQPMQDEQ